MHRLNKIQILERSCWGGNDPVFVTPEDRCFHTYIAGKTGSGKSTLLRNLLVQEIAFGHGVGLIDPHGDLAQELLDLIPLRRIDDVVYFNPGNLERPCAFNVLRCGKRPDLIASSVVSALRNIWSDSWGPRLEHILYASVAALAECQNVSLLGVQRLLCDDTYRSWVTKQVRDPLVRNFWLREYENYDHRFRHEAIAPVLNKIGPLLISPALRNVLGQVQLHLDFDLILDQKLVFIANLAKGLLGEDKSNLLGSLLVSQFELAGMARAARERTERPAFSLYIDEFQNFATESFATILAESRKYALNLTLSNQHLSQLRPGISDAVLGNVGSILCFRVGASDADRLARELDGRMDASVLSGLAKFQVAAKIMSHGEVIEPFLGTSLPPFGRFYGKSNAIVHRSNSRYTNSKASVEDKIKRWLGDDIDIP